MARKYVNTKMPTSPGEMAELLADPEAAARVIGGDWSGFHAQYTSAAGGADPNIDVNVKEEVQREIANWLRADGKANGGGGPRLNLDPNASGGKGGLYAKNAPGAALDGVLKSRGGPDMFGEFFSNAWHGNRSEAASIMQGEITRISNSFGSTVPSVGGLLIPETLRSEIMSLALEQSIVRPRATVIPMSSLRLGIPATDATSHESSLYGGLTAAWAEEGATLTDTSAKFAKVVLEASKLAIWSKVPNELLADGPALGAFIQMAFPAATAFTEDAAFIGGTGVGEPLGFLNAAATITATKETSQEADTIVWENIVAMYARMLPSSLSKAVWVVSPDAFPELATMGLSIGTGGSAVWLAGTDGTNVPAHMLGRPVLVSEKASKLGDAGDVSFVDFSAYLVGDRQQMTLKSSEHVHFDQDSTAFRAISRVDGRPWSLAPVTPRNGGDTLSAFVTLGARA